VLIWLRTAWSMASASAVSGPPRNAFAAGPRGSVKYTEYHLASLGDVSAGVIVVMDAWIHPVKKLTSVKTKPQVIFKDNKRPIGYLLFGDHHSSGGLSVQGDYSRWSRACLLWARHSFRLPVLWQIHLIAHWFHDTRFPDRITGARK
jgi:hypothetical protein